MRRFVSFCILFFPVVSPSFCAEPLTGRIGHIYIDREDVFNTSDPTQKAALYRIANAIHMRTHEQVVRRELLFKPGDAYNPRLIEETERNLRRFSFFREAKIEPVQNENGDIDINIMTKDTWTLEPQAGFSRVGGQNKSKVGVLERNLLGTGKSVSAFYNQDQQGTNRTFTYHDQQFFGRHLDLTGGYVDSQDFRQYGGSLSHPFYSTLTPYSFSVSEFFTDEEVPFLVDANETGRFERESRVFDASIGRSFSPNTHRTLQGTIGYHHESKQYMRLAGDLNDSLKPNSELSLIVPGLAWQKINFITERHIEKSDRDEDFNLGAGVNGNIGIGEDFKRPGVVQVLPKLGGQIGHQWSPGHFAMLNGNYHSRLADDETNDLLAHLDLQYFNRVRPWSTLAGHVFYDHGYQLDPENRLLLGEDTGLHAYPIGKFAGERRFLMNFEDRFFFADDVWHLVSFGATTFFDSGYAWDPGETFKLRSAIGAGLRIFFTRSSRNDPVRIDLAYALNNNGKSSPLVLSIRSGIKFGEDSATRRIDQ